MYSILYYVIYIESYIWWYRGCTVHRTSSIATAVTLLNYTIHNLVGLYFVMETSVWTCAEIFTWAQLSLWISIWVAHFEFAALSLSLTIYLTTIFKTAIIHYMLDYLVFFHRPFVSHHINLSIIRLILKSLLRRQIFLDVKKRNYENKIRTLKFPLEGRRSSNFDRRSEFALCDTQPSVCWCAFQMNDTIWNNFELNVFQSIRIISNFIYSTNKHLNGNQLTDTIRWCVYVREISTQVIMQWWKLLFAFPFDLFWKTRSIFLNGDCLWVAILRVVLLFFILIFWCVRVCVCVVPLVGVFTFLKAKIPMKHAPMLIWFDSSRISDAFN